MSQSASTQPQLIPTECDIMVNVRETEPAGKKETVSFFLRTAIANEYRKYAKAKKLKSAGFFFIHEQSITFVFDHPNPCYSKYITYRLGFGPDGVIVEPASLRPDPEIAPFLEPVNLSKVKNEFFDPADFQPRKRRLLGEPAAVSADNLQVNEIAPRSGVLQIPETRFITATRTPTISARGEERPFFRFGGQYLEKFGFAIGTPVTMVLEKNKITLSVAADQTVSKQPV